jgi:ferric-dicitrate binding protein FerR (iron transport regulator)
MIGNYNNVEDFLNDESFISFVYSANTKDMANWNLWLAQHAAKRPLAEEVASILKLIQIKEIEVSETRIAAAEAKIRVAIALNEKGEPAKVISIGRKRWYWPVAAVIIISLAFGLTYLFRTPEKKNQLVSYYGQVKKDKLPDGTEVTLNANSNITLGKKWEDGSAREVWVSGEAFFQVKKTLHYDKFIVHTNAFDIEVTGTSFNVINEDGKSSVILKEGSVKIHRPGESDILMKPGDFVEFANNQIEKKKIVKDDYLAWTQNKLVFDNTKLSDVAKIIKDHYGINVKSEEVEPGEKTITGIMPNDNLDVLLEALEATQEFTINRSQNLIIIRIKHH